MGSGIHPDEFDTPGPGRPSQARTPPKPPIAPVHAQPPPALKRTIRSSAQIQTPPRRSQPRGRIGCLVALVLFIALAAAIWFATSLRSEPAVVPAAQPQSSMMQRFATNYWYLKIRNPEWFNTGVMIPSDRRALVHGAVRGDPAFRFLSNCGGANHDSQSSSEQHQEVILSSSQCTTSISVKWLSAPPGGELQIQLILIPETAPSVNQLQSPPPPAPVRSARMDLIKVAESKNNVIDTEDWFRNNNLPKPALWPPLEDRTRQSSKPAGFPPEYQGATLVTLIPGSRRPLAIYGERFNGRYLVALNRVTHQPEFGLDLSPYLAPSKPPFAIPTLHWACEEGDVVHVSVYHRTYSNETNGLNGYIIAFNTADQRLIWKSRPMVSNTENFIIHNDVIITGYGFTREPDYLYALNKHSGEVVTKIALKTMAELIVRRDTQLYVRAYSMDYLFRLQ